MEIKILIVEDEILIAEDLKDKLLSFGYAEIEMAHNKTDAITAVREFNPDVVLLDVRMENEKDGIEIGQHIAEQFQKPFIYITAHSDVNLIKEILKTGPSGFITKPVKKSDLFAAINMVITQIKSSSDSALKIKDGYSTLVIHPDSIQYIESEGNYVNIYTDEKKHVSRQSLDSVISELNTKVFFRIHRSYLVNVSRITRFSKKEVVIDNTTLPVSRSLGEELEKFMRENQ
jgi:two-component system, LytTR family, response regulator LytT